MQHTAQWNRSFVHRNAGIPLNIKCGSNSTASLQDFKEQIFYFCSILLSNTYLQTKFWHFRTLYSLSEKCPNNLLGGMCAPPPKSDFPKNIVFQKLEKLLLCNKFVASFESQQCIAIHWATVQCVCNWQKRRWQKEQSHGTPCRRQEERIHFNLLLACAVKMCLSWH